MRKLAALFTLLLLIGTGCVRSAFQTRDPSQPQPTSTAVAPAQADGQPPSPGLACKPPLSIQSLHMVDEQVGWIVGMQDGLAVRRTEDGGKSWTDVTPPRKLLPQQILGTGATFTDGARGWIAMSSPSGDTTGQKSLITITRTTDGGKSWAATQLSVGRWENGPRLLFTGDQNGKMLVSSGPALGTMYKALYGTTDGGESWHPLSRNFGTQDAGGATPSALPLSEYVTGFTYRNATEGWVTALYRTTTEIPFYHTTDGGLTWQRQPLAYPNALNKVAYGSAYPPRFFGESRQDGIMLVTFSADPSMVVPYTTHDGGTTWNPQPGVAGWEQGQTDTWYSFIDTAHGFLLLDDKLQVTQDAGQHWQNLPAAAIKGGAIQFVNPANGWAVTADHFTLLHTTNGGHSWSLVGVPACAGEGVPVLLQAQTGMDNKHILSPNEQVFLLHRPIDLTLQFPEQVDLPSVKVDVRGKGWQVNQPSIPAGATGKRYTFTVEPGEGAAAKLTVTLTDARVGDYPLVKQPLRYFIETSAPDDLLTAPLVSYNDPTLSIRLSSPETANPPERRQQPDGILLSFRSGSIAIYQRERQSGKGLADLVAESIEANKNASHGRIVTDEQGKSQLGGQPAAFVQSHFDSAAGQYDQRLYFVLTASKAYSVTCQTKQGPPVVPWSDVAPVCDRILGTLQFAP